jgi:2-methylcitrate dehydratase PrpD
LRKDVADKARLLVIDAVGLALAAAREDFAQKAMSAIRKFGQGEDATAIGFAGRLPVTSAPLVNGMLIHAFDYDDTHHPLIIHNASVVVPAALAAAELSRASGKDFLDACARGFEVTLRVCRGTRVQSLGERGFHPTAVCGVFGAAAAAGRLLAGCQGSGNYEWQSDGSWSKRLQPGWSAHAGVVAAMLAAEGYTAPRTMLEGPRGFYASHVGEGNFDTATVTDGLGEAWELDRVEFKPYPCAGALQATVRACITLRNRHRLNPDDIVDVECRLRMGDRAEGPGREQVFSVQLPEGEYGAHFSTPYVAAVAFLKGRLTLADFDDEALRDPEVLKLASRIRRTDDPNHGRPKYASGHVFVRMKDGAVYEERQHVHPGHVENPVSPEDVEEKFHANARRLLDEKATRSLQDILISLEELADTRELTARLRNV